MPQAGQQGSQQVTVEGLQRRGVQLPAQDAECVAAHLCTGEKCCKEQVIMQVLQHSGSAQSQAGATACGCQPVRRERQ